jgi:hypothetical protein
MAVMDYRTQDGLASYAFSIEFESDVGWRVYIVFRPLYQGGEESKWSYEATSGSGRCYVNWPAKLDNLSDAKAVAALWADNAEYHAQGLTRSTGEEVKKAANPRAANRRTSAAA